MTSPRLIAVIGGTGAQGIPIVRDLVKSGKYTARVLTRDTSSARFKELQSYGPVEGVVGTFASEESLRATFRGAWGAFVNIDGFNSGEKTEIFWTIRGNTTLFPRGAKTAWELAIEEGVKFYVHGNIDYGYKKSGFRREFHCGHYDAKGRIAEWILAQNKDAIVRERMRSAVFTTGPYIEMTIGKNTVFPVKVEDGVAVWRVPLGDGAIPLTAVDECGVYVKYLFDHVDEADGLELQAAIEHVTFEAYVRAFEKVTGKPARWIDVDVNGHMDYVFGPRADTPCGYNADPNDPATMTLRQNFTAWFNLWRHSGGNKGILQRDYAVLDRIHPKRTKTVEEWIQKEHEKGLSAGLGSLWDRVQPENLGHVLKLTEDGRAGKI
ncbi:NAD(P)-binding protein [Xylariaceae sp. AK1471]|nr:NAD(P)-binding protein [Xylariaceae sp. AK1471]